MANVLIHASQRYLVKIENGILSELGEQAKACMWGNCAVIVSDSNVWPLYGDTTKESLERSGFSVRFFLIPAGEASKNADHYLSLLNYLAENHITRTDFLVALGGGVVGDLCGFAAATYLRGIDFIQVPTSLLAMADSSVGGKTAIDIPAGKNLIGAFYHPKVVLCDISLLRSLPEKDFLDGCAEVIKYAVGFDDRLFSHLQEFGTQFDLEWVITRCLLCKRNAVEQDEFDNGQRKLLNLGHTFGHSIEKESGFTITHGRAVAMGIAMAARCAEKMGICTSFTASLILELLEQFRLPTQAPYAAAVLAGHALSDKKREQDEICLILPESLGRAKVFPIHISQLEAYFEAGSL